MADPRTDCRYYFVASFCIYCGRHKDDCNFSSKQWRVWLSAQLCRIFEMCIAVIDRFWRIDHSAPSVVTTGNNTVNYSRPSYSVFCLCVSDDWWLSGQSLPVITLGKLFTACHTPSSMFYYPCTNQVAYIMACCGRGLVYRILAKLHESEMGASSVHQWLWDCSVQCISRITSPCSHLPAAYTISYCI